MTLRDDDLRRRLDALYLQYDHRFVDPDPHQFVRAHGDPADREVVGLIASALAYGNVLQIKKSIGAALAPLGSRPAQAIRDLDPQAVARALTSFKHRFNDGRDVACLFFFLRQMIEASGTVEAFFASGDDPTAADVAPGLTSFTSRALDLDHGGLYGRGTLPPKAGVRFFFPSPASGSACKRLNLYLRWMVRKDSVDLGAWTCVARSRLVIPLDAHVYAIARKARLTRYKSPGWAMAVDLTARLRRLDPVDPVKYDFAFHRMGLLKKAEEIRSLREAP